MLVTLVSLPWSAHPRPSAALGTLSAFLRANNPSWAVKSRSEYLRVATTIGYPLYTKIAQEAYSLGELLYLALLYPEREGAIREHFARTAPKMIKDVGVDAGRAGAVFDEIRGTLARSADDLARDLAADSCDVVGFTTCFGQLFANLVVAARLKELRPRARVVFGGSTVSARVGVSVLEEYASVDHVVQGEGERPLSALLRAIEAGEVPGVAPGLLSRVDGRAPTAPAELCEVERLDDLPVPDYDEYAEMARELGVDWAIPIEGSRGCWWDRGRRTGNPKSTCYFCNLNVQWKGYREKGASRVVEELKELSDRYETTLVYFLDNIIRVRGIHELAGGIAALGKDFDIFYEMRANVRPDEILALWEAGLTSVQFGIEALSSKVLVKIGKVTRLIQNLEVMKTCFELGVRNAANLITDFPGTSMADVEETVGAIRRFALPYEPCATSPFGLGIDSTVDTLRDTFGITNVRNTESLRVGLPEQSWRRLKLFDLDFDAPGAVDWSPVYAAVEEWRARRRAVGGPILAYYDGGKFLRINDRRRDWDVFILQGRQRELVLFCARIRSRQEIVARFGEAALETLSRLVAVDLVFEEGGRYLTLATASSPRVAAARIRAEVVADPVAKAQESA
jgi:ribosomal peptide maturation radical SAM protein 1